MQWRAWAEMLRMIADAARREWPDCAFLGEETFDASGKKRVELDDVCPRRSDSADSIRDRPSSQVRPQLR